MQGLDANLGRMDPHREWWAHRGPQGSSTRNASAAMSVFLFQLADSWLCQRLVYNPRGDRWVMEGFIHQVWQSDGACIPPEQINLFTAVQYWKINAGKSVMQCIENTPNQRARHWNEAVHLWNMDDSKQSSFSISWDQNGSYSWLDQLWLSYNRKVTQRSTCRQQKFNKSWKKWITSKERSDCSRINYRCNYTFLGSRTPWDEKQLTS